MYTVGEILPRISAHPVVVVALGTVALLCNYTFFFEGARCGRRDRCQSFYLLASTLWFAHDLNYLADFPTWFLGLDHWFPKLFWVGLLVTFSFEVVFLYQSFRHGRREAGLAMSRGSWNLYVVGAIVLGLVLWAVAKETLADPLYLMTFMLTAVWALGSGFAMAVRRGDRSGQSVVQWIAFTGMILTYGAVSISVFGGAFQGPRWIALCGAGVLGGLGMAWFVSRLPRSRETSAAVQPSVASIV
ncbi:hypothetical protein [Actinomycetospora sp. TBRC 11914]|uniref:hypothetical protein n=1 Tax=Actinomycetospora sp. TBRC 11914 TaxID=2729387 RepID=UPI00145E1F57|nr:hypothetical protein [Actinomycetospora sp. TBRC 11914]NMO91697.1 hypothetical protein [Actinomycetospora sp. TBRC 11914]